MLWRGFGCEDLSGASGFQVFLRSSAVIDSWLCFGGAHFQGRNWSIKERSWQLRNTYQLTKTSGKIRYGAVTEYSIYSLTVEPFLRQCSSSNVCFLRVSWVNVRWAVQKLQGKPNQCQVDYLYMAWAEVRGLSVAFLWPHCARRHSWNDRVLIQVPVKNPGSSSVLGLS